MNRFRRAVLWVALIGILLLVLLSIYGAFLGAGRAQDFFSSLPLAVYWFALVALLVVGITFFRRLWQTPALLLMHVGSVLVLIGAMWGSNGGHAIARQLFGIDKIPQGLLGVLPESQENRVLIEDTRETRELPFFVRLRDFRIEYYQPGELFIRSRTGQRWRLPAEAGQTLALGQDLGTVTIRRVFENFKIDLQDDEPVVSDEPGGSNPALEVWVERPGGSSGRRYVFEQAPGHMSPNDPLTMSYGRMIRSYISEVEIVRDGQVVAAQNIEVNHPLHYGGYHLYQSDVRQDEFGVYPILLVVSDAGLNLVYSGYAMLIVGVLWHFWGRRIWAFARGRQRSASEVLVQHE
jgi:hypothetical protein